MSGVFHDNDLDEIRHGNGYGSLSNIQVSLDTSKEVQNLIDGSIHTMMCLRYYHVGPETGSIYNGPCVITGCSSGGYGQAVDARTRCGLYFGQGWPGGDYPGIGSSSSIIIVVHQRARLMLALKYTLDSILQTVLFHIG